MDGTSFYLERYHSVIVSAIAIVLEMLLRFFFCIELAILLIMPIYQLLDEEVESSSSTTRMASSDLGMRIPRSVGKPF